MNYLYIFGLLGLLLITSGCMNIDGGEETSSEGTDAITIEELSVTPQTIFADSSTTAILHVRNSGELDANLTIDSGWRQTRETVREECGRTIPPGLPSDIADEYDGCTETIVSEQELHGNLGDRLLTNRCRDIFNIEDFTARGPGDIESDYYNLPSGAEARFTWSLDSSTANVPLQGLSCDLRFQVPFDYDVTAFRQLQFVESNEVPGVSELNSRSSRGPMMINIETLGSTSQQGPSTFVQGDNAEIIVTLRNQVDEESSYTGFIEASVPEIEAVGFDFAEGGCTETLDEDTLTMYRGESQQIRCPISDEVFEDLQGSKQGEVRVETNYTYIKTLGSQEVEVEYRGN